MNFIDPQGEEWPIAKYRKIKDKASASLLTHESYCSGGSSCFVGRGLCRYNLSSSGCICASMCSLLRFLNVIYVALYVVRDLHIKR